ncbi:hypothetical protein U8527_05065 [Kordia algicida OT-1]|uniref:Lipoprotein n=1 Tax=Kordia algicida OT-1 TaxID=391587 RepID=A9DMF2_9FLAO|nr:hypothetical protein [Kordia algicida]EDP97691.1 hypothetical protein KAOT1_21052 [Kordia algicida OT-1]
MMKKVVYIICFIVCFSCNNATQKSDNAIATEAVEEVSIDKDGLLDTETKLKDAIDDFSLNDVNAEIEDKLQANYEAVVLATKHPEFREAIKEQLADSDKFNVLLSDSIQSIEIKDIDFSSSVTSRNERVSTQKVSYTILINSKYTQKDSVLVVMKRSMIKIDEAVKVNTSFSFERID